MGNSVCQFVPILTSCWGDEKEKLRVRRKTDKAKFIWDREVNKNRAEAENTDKNTKKMSTVPE